MSRADELLGRKMEFQLMRIASRVLSVTCLALVALTTASVHAVPLQSDPNGLDGGVPALWQGTKAYLQAAPVGTGSLNALVDFAVFAPTKFNLSYPGMDPSAGANYVYAYQVHNGAGTASISTLSVGLSGGNETPSGIGFVPAGGAAPSSTKFNPGGAPFTSAGFSYTGALLAPGATSHILIFTSPFGPELDYASLIGGISKSERLPSPVPEPATIVLLGLGALALLAARRNKTLAK